MTHEIEWQYKGSLGKSRREDKEGMLSSVSVTSWSALIAIWMWSQIKAYETDLKGSSRASDIIVGGLLKTI